MNKQYIKYNIGQVDGCGVIVENFFIIPAQLISIQNKFVYEHDGNRFRLSSNDSFHFYVIDETSPDKQEYEFSVYYIKEIQSPLKLSIANINNGDILKSISYQHFADDDIEYYELIENTATVKRIDDDFFICSMKKALKKESWGSPLFDTNGNICGILCSIIKESRNHLVLKSSSFIQYLTDAINKKNDLLLGNLELLEEAYSLFNEYYFNQIKSTLFLSAPSERKPTELTCLNSREIFISLTQLEIPENTIHDNIFQIDTSGVYHDEILMSVSNANYKQFKEIIQTKGFALNKASDTLLNYLANTQNNFVAMSSEHRLNNDALDFLVYVVDYLIEKGIISQEEEKIFKYFYSNRGKDEYKKIYEEISLSRKMDFINNVKIIDKVLRKTMYFCLHNVDCLNKSPLSHKFLSNQLLHDIQFSRLGDDAQYVIDASKNLSIRICYEKFYYMKGRGIIAKFDEQLKEIEASQIGQLDNDVSDDKDSTQDKREAIASPVVDFSEIFASQVPNVDYKTMRAIAAKLTKESNTNTDSQSAYIRPIDVPRFCYFFLHEINVPDRIDKIDFSYPIQWFGRWEILKYFIIKLYKLKSLPSNLGKEVVKAFRFRKLRNTPGQEGELEETTFNHSYHQKKVGDENITRINSILKEFNLLK